MICVVARARGAVARIASLATVDIAIAPREPVTMSIAVVTSAGVAAMCSHDR